MLVALMLITALISLAIAFGVLLLLGGMIERALLRVNARRGQPGLAQIH